MADMSSYSSSNSALDLEKYPELAVRIAAINACAKRTPEISYLRHTEYIEKQLKALNLKIYTTYKDLALPDTHLHLLALVLSVHASFLAINKKLASIASDDLLIEIRSLGESLESNRYQGVFVHTPSGTMIYEGGVETDPKEALKTYFGNLMDLAEQYGESLQEDKDWPSSKAL